MKVIISQVRSDGRGDAQEWEITASRVYDRVFDRGNTPVADLPADIRDALLKWLTGD